MSAQFSLEREIPGVQPSTLGLGVGMEIGENLSIGIGPDYSFKTFERTHAALSLSNEFNAFQGTPSS